MVRGRKRHGKFATPCDLTGGGAALKPGAALNVNDIPSDAEVLGYSVELRPTAFGARQTIFCLSEDRLRFFPAESRLVLSL